MKIAAVSIGRLSLPTYRVLEANLNPMLNKRLDPYPYTLMDLKSYDLEDVEYEAVFLENEYLKLTILPELGAHLYSAYDKRSGREVFYKNPVIKPRMIATRGAWISGGVEFNFPISHSPTTMDRVNYIVEKYDDGSVSIVFGNLEQISGMNWKVELRLYPGKAYIEENVRLYNPTALENRYYFWTNAAVQYTDDMQLIYPFDWCINNKTPGYIKWPYFDGINHTDPKAIPNSYETFGKLLKENYFGTYDYTLDSGVVHYADRKKLKGAKFFIWGNDGRAEMWNRALNGEGDKYIEVQSGPFESQGVYKFLRPHQEVSWSEYWYPVFGTGGFKYAEKELVMNYSPVDGGVEFRLLALEDLESCKIIFRTSGKSFSAEKSLTPDKVESVFFELEKSFNMNSEFEFDVYSEKGHIMTLGKRDEFNPEPLDTDLYEDSKVVGSKEDNRKLYKQAVTNESFGLLEKALELYGRNLAENADCHNSMLRMALIYIRTGRPEKAQELLHKVLSYDNRNTEARFLYAAAEKDRGNLKAARRLFMDIAADNTNFEASAIELVKLNIQFRYYKDAQVVLENNITIKTGYTAFLAAISHRRDGLREKAVDILKASAYRDEYTLAELYCCRADGSREAFMDYTRGDARVIKTIALEYAAMGLYTEAEDILALTAESDVKVKLLSMYLSGKTGNKGFSLQDITGGNIDYAFVNEKLLVQILDEYKDKDETGVLDYMLGTWKLSAARWDEGLESLLDAYSKGLRYTVLLRNLGYVYFNRKAYESAAKYFEEDLLLNGGANADSSTYLDRIYRERGDLESRRKLIPYMNSAHNRSLVLPFLCGIYKDIGEEEKAVEILHTDEFEVWEGFELTGRVYWDVLVSLVEKCLAREDLLEAGRYIDIIRTYPDNLNFGESPRDSLADVYYYTGLVKAGLGDEKAALEAFEQGARQLERLNLSGNAVNREYALKCIEELQKRFF